ncbi:MAG: bifunctional enoyl-CoA hydratase/phosphate acetyltransferase [Candidatus Binatia bacterium]
MGTEPSTSRTFDDLSPGDAVSLTRTLVREDVAVVEALARTYLPAAVFAGGEGATYPIGFATWAGMMVPLALGTALPGPGTVYRAQTVRFHEPVYAGDTVTVTITVKDKRAEDRVVVLDCVARNQDRRTVLTGTAEVIAPRTRVERLGATPDLIFHDHRRYEALVARCQGLPTMVAAVAHPCDESSLAAAIGAADAKIIQPVLVGPAAKIRAVAAAHALDIAAFEIVDVPHSHAAAAKAVELVRTGRAQLVMKGSLHTEELMHEVTAHETGLRTERRISHVFVLDVPTYHKPLFVTDAAINIAPGLEEKVDILKNAIELAHALGVAEPKIAILSAVETVTAKIPSTLEAAALCKMADRRQITGAVLDGPLAMDNAISRAAAKAKGIESPVAGDADVLLAPDLEAGNILYKELTFLANADAAGIVLGARAPIILTSRADSVRAKLASCAVAALFAHARRRTASALG